MNKRALQIIAAIIVVTAACFAYDAYRRNAVGPKIEAILASSRDYRHVKCGRVFGLADSVEGYVDTAAMRDRLYAQVDAAGGKFLEKYVRALPKLDFAPEKSRSPAVVIASILSSDDDFAKITREHVDDTHFVLKGTVANAKIWNRLSGRLNEAGVADNADLEIEIAQIPGIHPIEPAVPTVPIEPVVPDSTTAMPRPAE